MVALARAGVLEQLRYGPVDVKAIPGNQTCLSVVFDLLATLGWVARERNTVRLTPSGSYAAEIAASYGVTVSYIPLFTVVSSLLFGNARIPRMDDSGAEIFVNRAMNVWGSGGAHKNYFKKVDEIVIELFNRPIGQQPRGICDMGCGDGTLLEHLYSVIKNQTRRGEVLDQFPLMLVGADFNKVARRITTQRLRKAGVPAFHVIHGDINRPAQLASDLEKWATTSTICCTPARFSITTDPIFRLTITRRTRVRRAPPARLRTSAKRFRPVSWRRIWCGTSNDGRPMWAASVSW